MNWNKWKEKWVVFSFSILIPIMIIFCVGFTIMYPMWVAHIEFDRVEEQMFEDVYDANATDEWKDGWISAVKHFGVLWRSGENMTSSNLN